MWNSFLENICENLFHPRVVVRHPQADPGEEGSKEGQELTAEDQDYPDNRVEVLLGHVVPFSGADPTHFSCSLMPWVVATATASASNLTWVQEQVTKQNGKNGRKSIFQGIAQPWHMKTFLTFENLIIMLTFKETQIHQKSATCSSHCSVLLTCSVPGSPRQWQHQEIFWNSSAASHSFRGAFLKCPRNHIGKQRHAARESLKRILFIFTHHHCHSLDSSFAEQNPITKQHNLLLQKNTLELQGWWNCSPFSSWQQIWRLAGCGDPAALGLDGQAPRLPCAPSEQQEPCWWPGEPMGHRAPTPGPPVPVYGQLSPRLDGDGDRRISASSPICHSDLFDNWLWAIIPPTVAAF